MVARLTLHHERVLIEDIHDQADWLLANRTDHPGLMNGGHL